MIGAAFIESDTEEVADAQGIGGAPGDAAFGINTFEIANQEGAEVDGWSETGPPHFLGVELLAGGFGELVRLFGFEQLVEL